MEMSVGELGEKRGALGKPVWTGYTVQLLGPKTGQVGNKPESKGRLGWGGSPKCSKDTVFGELSPWGLGGGLLKICTLRSGIMAAGQGKLACLPIWC